MDFVFLPEKIKTKIKDETGRDDTPLAVVRSSGSIDGKSGEGYIIGYPDSILVFSKTFGDNDYAFLGGRMGQGITDFSLRKDKYNIFLAMTLGGQTYDVKISSLEESDCAKLLEAWEAHDPAAAPAVAPPPVPPQAQVTTPPPVPPTPSPAPSQPSLRIAGKVPPLVGLGATLMFVATVDGEIDQNEDDYIRKVLANNEDVLQKSLDYYKENSFEKLLADLSLDHQQKLCIFCNMNEIAMSDGVLHSVEQRMLKQFADAMGISNDEYQAIRDVLLIKNQVSVLDGE